VLLEGLRTDARSLEGATSRAFELMRRLYPINRSITGSGVRQTLDLVEQIVPLERTEVPSGTKVFDWEVPNEWNLRDAYIADGDGRRIVDFRAHNLHVVGYSRPVRRRLALRDLQQHLHSIPERPDRIPYRTTYYADDWGFCLAHRQRESLADGEYDVVIDAELSPGHLTYAEAVIPGHSGDQAVVYTHTCHPSLANDNLTGMATAALIAQALGAERPCLTWRFVFGPGTIGSLTWLANNEDQLGRIRCGLVIGLLGDAGAITYKRSRAGQTMTDRAAELLLGRYPDARVIDFEPYGYDERQFCSPGFNLPVGRLTRSVNGGYDEYHTSADDLSLVKPHKLAESLRLLAELVAVMDSNRRVLNLAPKGEPRLGKRGLYGSVGGMAPADAQHALLWVLNQADGRNDLIDISRRSGMAFEQIAGATARLESAGLVRALHWPTNDPEPPP
jgi:aminopeptidase-like protein